MSAAPAPLTVAELILQRVGRPYAIEAVRLLESGQAGVLAIDTALEAAGYPMGPLRRLDEAGLDVDLRLDRFLAASYPSSGRFEPPQLQVRLVAEGRCGRAAGRGFYRYAGASLEGPSVEGASVGPDVVTTWSGPLAADAPPAPDPPLAADAPPAPDAPLAADAPPAPDLPLAADAIVERLELATVNEAYRVLEDGLGSPPAIDAIMRAAGQPRGPFEMVDRDGLRHIVDRLRALEAVTEARSGDQYRVATLLWQMATV